MRECDRAGVEGRGEEVRGGEDEYDNDERRGERAGERRDDGQVDPAIEVSSRMSDVACVRKWRGLVSPSSLPHSGSRQLSRTVSTCCASCR